MTEWHAASLTRARAVVPTIEQPTIKKGKRSVTADLLAYLAVELE